MIPDQVILELYCLHLVRGNRESSGRDENIAHTLTKATLTAALLVSFGTNSETLLEATLQLVPVYSLTGNSLTDISRCFLILLRLSPCSGSSWEAFTHTVRRFAFLRLLITHMLAETSASPFSGVATSPLKSNPNRRQKQKGNDARWILVVRLAPVA